MVRALPAILLFATAVPLPGAEQVVVLGDSLSKEYEFSFRFDGFSRPGTVRNWIEILDAERPEFFHTGSHIDVNALFVDIFFRRQFNWAVPGSKIAQISAFLRGELEFVEFYSSSDPTTFETVINAIGRFVTDGDFDLADLDEQLRHHAERVVLLAGGNDIDEVYREIYEADPSFDASAWTASFLSEAAFIMDWVLARNPSIQFVVVALPHVGITPNVKASHPTDPIKTARVTAVMRGLNHGLASLARERGIAFADIFDPMLRLLPSSPLCIHGVPFVNDVPPDGTDPGHLDYAWLNGTASDGFHPNTNAQALIANEIVHAFNTYYGTSISPLTATEILHDWLGKDPELGWNDWLSCYGISGAAIHDDRDRDGMPAGLEFGLGGDPLRPDAWLVEFRRGSGDGAPYLAVTWPLRLEGTTRVAVLAEWSGDLVSWHPLPSTPAPAGRFEARLPITSRPGFLRLHATIP